MDLYEGTVKKGDEQLELPFRVRKLTIDDLTKILRIQEQVVMELENKERLQPLSKGEFEYILEGNGLMIGALVQNELIACRALLVPPIDEKEHLGLDIGLAESELSNVIYQELSIVLPAYRGNQLQKMLGQLIMQELEKDIHPYRYVCCTVAPFNIPSLKDKFAQGMKIAALKEKYGGLLRYIFVKNLMETESRIYGELTLISMEDIPFQQEKLAAGWQGLGMEEKENKIWVRYGH